MKASIERLALVTGLSLGLLALPVAHGEGESDGMTVMMTDNFATADPANIKWMPNKSVPDGMQMVMLYGHPSQPGPYIFRAKIPSGYKLPPHRHPDERTVTVLQGTYLAGVGERYDPTAMKALQVGAFYITKANVPHYAGARTDVLIQEMGTGPLEKPIDYVNPDDDPRKQ